MDKIASPAASSSDDVLAFWFRHSDHWWKQDPAFDAEVRDGFQELHGAIERDEREDWLETPRPSLAYVVVLDQFSRNMFRGSPRMFEGDARALAAARRAVDRGFDRELSRNERMFLYMPFMHSENMADQVRSRMLFAALEEWLRYAEEHHDIIRRFGRFPHRNALLGRSSSPVELAFLKQQGGL